MDQPGKRPRSTSPCATTTSKKSKVDTTASDGALAEQLRDREKQNLIDQRNREFKERQIAKAALRAERKRLLEEERKKAAVEKAAARLVRQSAQKRKRAEKAAVRKAKEDRIAAEKERKAEAKEKIREEKASKRRDELARLKSEKDKESIAKKAENMLQKKKRSQALKMKFEEEEGKRQMKAGLEAQVVAERSKRKKEANRVKKIQENARFAREQFELTYRACYPIEDSSLTTDETVHPSLPVTLPPRPTPKGRLLGCLSSSWERGALLACYDVLYLFAPNMKLLPRFGVHDLHDGLARTDMEIELVTSCVCALLKIILPENVRVYEVGQKPSSGDGSCRQCVNPRSHVAHSCELHGKPGASGHHHKFVQVGASSSSSSSSAPATSPIDTVNHELFGRHAPAMEAVSPTTYSEIVRMVFRCHSAVLTGGGLPKTAKGKRD